MSRINRAPVSISNIKTQLAGKAENAVVAVVGSVVDDERLLDLPKVTVAGLRFSSSVRERITKVLFTFLLYSDSPGWWSLPHF